MKHCKVNHFTDDTILLNFKSSIKKIKKVVGYDYISHIGSILTKFALISVKVKYFFKINKKADRNHFKAKIKW